MARRGRRVRKPDFDDGDDDLTKENACDCCGEPLKISDMGDSRCRHCQGTRDQLYEPNGRRRRFIINSDELPYD